MRCSNCGKEFGTGTHCQNCGIDRVAGLANYSGFDSHAGSNNFDSSSYGGQTSQKTTVCYACNEIIPLGATYCPVCGKKLIVTCPKCGHEYSSQYPVCSECGTNREEYNERKRREEEKKKAWEQSPKGKAELAREEEERKRQVEEAEKEKRANMIVYLIMTPIWGLMWYGGIDAFFPELGINIPKVWPNTFPTNLIICFVLGYITQYIFDSFDS